MPKNKPTLDAKAWDRIWLRYEKWFSAHLKRKNRSQTLPTNKNADRAIQRIVNAELRRLADGKKT